MLNKCEMLHMVSNLSKVCVPDLYRSSMILMSTKVALHCCAREKEREIIFTFSLWLLYAA